MVLVMDGNTRNASDPQRAELLPQAQILANEKIEQMVGLSTPEVIELVRALLVDLLVDRALLNKFSRKMHAAKVEAGARINSVFWQDVWPQILEFSKQNGFRFNPPPVANICYECGAPGINKMCDVIDTDPSKSVYNYYCGPYGCAKK